MQKRADWPRLKKHGHEQNKSTTQRRPARREKVEKERKETEEKEAMERKGAANVGIVDNMDIQQESALHLGSYTDSLDRMTQAKVAQQRQCRERLVGKEGAKEARERLDGRAKARAMEKLHSILPRKLSTRQHGTMATTTASGWGRI